MMRRFTHTMKILTASLTAGVLLLGSGCAAKSGGSAANADSITVAVPTLATSYDYDSPNQFSNENFTVNSQTQANLFRHPYEKSAKYPSYSEMNFSKFEPVLADPDNPYKISDDGLTYTFKLRKGVLSQAGNPLTAEDVRWSFERKAAGASGALTQLKPYLTDVKQISVVDDQHVAFHFNKNDAGNIILYFLSMKDGRIYDKKELLKHATADDPWAFKWSNTHSGWGFGPYTVDSVTPDQQMVLKANPNYVLGEPKIKTVTFQVTANSGTRAQMLKAGNVQVAESLTPSDSQSLESSDSIVAPTVENPIEFSDLVTVSTQAPFDNKLVRQAFRYAIPYDQIIKDVYKGRGTESHGWLSPRIKGMNADPVYSYNPTKAKALLTEAGKSDVTVTLHVSTAVQDLIDSALMIKSYAKDAGFNINVQQDSPADLATGRTNKTFQAFLVKNRSQIQAPIFTFTAFFYPVPTDPNNTSAFKPENLDEYNSLVDKARQVKDPFSAEAATYWNQLQHIVVDDASNLPMLYMQPSQAYSKKLTGATYRFDNTMDYSMLSFSK